MKKDITLLNRLLEKYKFIISVPEEIQKFVINSRIRSLKKNLKITGDFSLTYWPAVRIFFEARKFGFKPGFTASQVIAGAGAAIAAGIVVSGAVAVYSLIETKPAVNIEKKVETKTVEKKQEIKPVRKKPEKKKMSLVKKDEKKIVGNKEIEKEEEITVYQFGVKLFQGKNVDSDIAESITDKISGELAQIKGKNNVINLRLKQGKAKKELIGSIGRLGDSYYISAKVVDKKSRVLSVANERISTLEEIPKACTGIVNKISGEVD